MKRKINAYEGLKSIIANSMWVEDWWKTDTAWNRARQAFGIGALKRGVQKALDKGEQVPQTVLDFVSLNRFNNGL